MYEGLLGLLQPRPPVSQRLVFMAIVAHFFRGIRTHPARLRSLTEGTRANEFLYQKIELRVALPTGQLHSLGVALQRTRRVVPLC
jgi:hypothetical protein